MGFPWDSGFIPNKGEDGESARAFCIQQWRGAAIKICQPRFIPCFFKELIIGQHYPDSSMLGVGVDIKGETDVGIFRLWLIERREDMKQEITLYIWPGMAGIDYHRIVGGEPFHIPDDFRPREIREPVGEIDFRYHKKPLVSNVSAEPCNQSTI